MIYEAVITNTAGNIIFVISYSLTHSRYTNYFDEVRIQYAPLYYTGVEHCA